VNVEIAAAWEAAYASLSPGLVRYEIAWGAGHVIQADRPDLVIAAIRRLIEAADG
jgi:pimeloyl-ACP methyl ester carboxylesterase